MAQITLNSSGVASNGTLKLQSNGTTDAVTIDTSQNVGIGTSSPSRKLEVYSTSASFGKITAATTNQSVLEINNNGGANNFYIGIDTSTGGAYGAGSYGRVLYSDGAFPIVFSTNSSERMRIDSAGNVGIGTASPNRKLVVSNAGAAGFEFGAGVGAGSGNEVLNYNRSTSLYIPSSAYASTHTFYAGTAGGTRALDIDSSGNVGIGTTSPSSYSSLLAIVGSSPQQTIQDSGANGSRLLLQATNSAVYIGTSYSSSNIPTVFTQAGTSGGTERMRIDSSGRLLVGTSSTLTSLTGAVIQVAQSAADYCIASDSTSSTAANCYGVYIRYPNASPNGTGNSFYTGKDSAALRFEVRSNGGIANYSGNNVNLSDRREKTNFAPAGDYLSKICAIPVQTFNYIDQNMEEDAGLTLGVVAQDVQAVAPELVSESNWGTEENPKMRLSIYQTDLQYALMKCIQEQQTIIQTLTARIEALENK